MKKLIISSIVFIFTFSISQVSAQSNKIDWAKQTEIYPKGFLGASAIIGVTVPYLSYGVGARLLYYIPNSNAGTFAEIELNRRGGYDTGVTYYVNNDQEEPFKLNYIDFNFGPQFGETFFLASGLSTGILINKGDGVDYPDKISHLDFGGIISIGYKTKSEPKALFGIDFKYSFTNLYDPYYFLPSNNITWGFIFGLSF